MEVEIFICEPWTWIETTESNPPPEGIEAHLRQRLQAQDPATLAYSIILSVATGVPASMAAAWLYDHLVKHGAKRITIDRQEIVVDKGEIQRIITEHIEIRE